MALAGREGAHILLLKKIMVISDPTVVNPAAVLLWLCHVRIWYGNAFRNVTSITIIIIDGRRIIII